MMALRLSVLAFAFFLATWAVGLSDPKPCAGGTDATCELQEPGSDGAEYDVDVTELLQHERAGRRKAHHGGHAAQGADIASAAAVFLDDDVQIAFVFTTSCSGEYQLYQSAVLEWTWKDVGNQGTLSRVITGCKSEEDKAYAMRSPLAGDPRFHIFVTEGDLGINPRTGKLYPARGRPWSLMQWIAAGLPPWSAQHLPSMVAVLDPDFAMLRPLSAHPRFKDVSRGHMFAATYDMGGDWIKYFAAIGEVAPGINANTALESYSSGPPWVVERTDFQAMLPLWGDYTDKMDARGNSLLNEQYSFMMAAATQSVPMLPDGNTMVVSNPGAYREVWTGKCDSAEWNQAYLLHYCMPIDYKGWHWHKSLITRKGWYAEHFDNALPGILECQTPGLQEPPAPPSSSVEPDGNKIKWAWFLYRLFPRINAATSAFRSSYCPKPSSGDTPEVLPQRLIRTLFPRGCGGRKTTMYLTAAPPDEVADWNATGLEDASFCSAQNQAL
mmetsp:Transcript_80233/g.260027  ORF Transcript_80233/g.260027 Transcript_80233/m.260027 type:complete len:497 (+) Transcript_80233:58-1548(+)